MSLEWKQEQRYAAQADKPGKFYRIFPFSDSTKFGASVVFLNEEGNLATTPIGIHPFDTVEEAKAACEADAAKS